MNSTEKKYFVTSELFEELEPVEISLKENFFVSGGEKIFIRRGEQPGLYYFERGGKEFPVIAHYDSKGNVKISFNGYIYDFCVSSEKEFSFSKMLRATSEVKPMAAKIVSPMPGLIKGISVANGQHVKKGENLFILEAMKMENIIKAPITGTVHNLTIKEGNTVEKSTVLCVLDPQ